MLFDDAARSGVVPGTPLWYASVGKLDIRVRKPRNNRGEDANGKIQSPNRR